MTEQSIKSSLVFWLHTLLVLAAWVGPFLITWRIMVAAYVAVMIQFAIFGKCLMNEHHGLDESDGRIFYSELLEKIGFHPDPKLVKNIVRQWLYPIFALVTLVWQIVLGHEPWWF